MLKNNILIIDGLLMINVEVCNFACLQIFTPIYLE